MKTAFLSFFPVFPTNMGSAEVVRSLFINWPGKKKIFQISHLEKINTKSIFTMKIFFEKPILKIIAIPFVLINILFFLHNGRKKVIVIEGPSWIGYSFLSIVLLKILSPKTIIIYHSHSIEYEVRKMTSNKIITYLTSKLERLVFHMCNICTTVSLEEMRKIKKYYNIKPILLPNGISKKRLKFNKKLNFKFPYLIYSGSYKYFPNKEAIDFLIEKIMPKLIKRRKNLKLLITGGGYNKKKDFVINLGIINKKKLLNLIYNSMCMPIPLMKGTGTRIKILEALLIGGKVISTPKGFEGIPKYGKKNKYPLISNPNSFFKLILKNLNNKSRINKKIINKYKKDFLMENIVKKFFINQNVSKYF